jgi:hypothetical protein
VSSSSPDFRDWLEPPPDDYAALLLLPPWGGSWSFCVDDLRVCSSPLVSSGATDVAADSASPSRPEIVVECGRPFVFVTPTRSDRCFAIGDADSVRGATAVDCLYGETLSLSDPSGRSNSDAQFPSPPLLPLLSGESGRCFGFV